MSLDDFKALLWHYGGNLGRGSGRTDHEAAHRPELFLFIAANFLSIDARLTTCIFNLTIELASKVSAADFKQALLQEKYNPAYLGILVAIVREELQRRSYNEESAKWISIENNLRKELPVHKMTKPLLPHLPSLPGRCDPLFLVWGFEYPGIVREPEKYLRKAI